MSVKNGFDPKDLEEITSRNPLKFKMKKADYKELGRNLLLGTVDFAIGSIQATALAAKFLDNSTSSKRINHLENEQKDRADRVWKRGDYIEANNCDD
ncbi:hypothetical protein [Rahnella aceris]